MQEKIQQILPGGPETITMVTTPDQAYGQFLSRMDEPEIRKQLYGKNIYEITVKNVGGLIMPVTIEWQYTDDTSEIDTLPAEIWRLNEYEITKTFIKEKQVNNVVLDPNFEFADTDMKNNSFPKVEETSDFDTFKNNKITSDVLDTYVGNYKMDEGFTAKVYLSGNDLYIQVDGQPANQLHPESKTLFMVKEFPAKAEFVPSTNGGKMGIILSREEEKYKGVKIE